MNIFTCSPALFLENAASLAFFYYYLIHANYKKISHGLMYNSMILVKYNVHCHVTLFTLLYLC